ncbi:hypothetical protein Bbelb_046760 [Branchiostoma belcheri]|nr:hypothetical protein Bbelb_046760 [Branchiostoma belcheri]
MYNHETCVHHPGTTVPDNAGPCAECLAEASGVGEGTNPAHNTGLDPDMSVSPPSASQEFLVGLTGYYLGERAGGMVRSEGLASTQPGAANRTWHELRHRVAN